MIGATDFESILCQLTEASCRGFARNCPIPVVIPPGDYQFSSPIVCDSRVDIYAVGVRLGYVGPDGESVDNPTVLFDWSGGHGAKIEGLEIILNKPTKNVVLFRSDGPNKSSRNVISRLRLDATLGNDCRALQVGHAEQMTISDCQCIGSIPLTVGSGDNYWFGRMSLNAATDEISRARWNTALRSACIEINAKADHLTIRDSTLQGGDFAIHAEWSSQIFASGLFLSGIRHEQKIGQTTLPSVLVDAIGMHLESLSIGAGCRFADNPVSLDLRNVWAVDVDKATRITGQRTWIGWGGARKVWNYKTGNWKLEAIQKALGEVL